MTILQTGVARTLRSPVTWAVNGLGLYVLLMYGITYYAVSTAAPRVATGFGVPVSAIFALLTASLLLTAFLAPFFGRWTDRIGAASVLTIGALVRSAALAAMALAPDYWIFAAAFVVVQIAGQLTEYDAAFAAAVDVAGERSRVAMSQITLWGGLASTAFWPATAWLLDVMSWRSTFLVYAALMLATCLPIALLLRRLRRQGATSRTAAPAAPADPAPSIRRPPPLALVAVAFALGGIAYNLPVLMLPVLEGLGLGVAAVAVGMLFGPSQTAGRFVDMVVGTRAQATTVALVAAATVALALLLLLLAGGGVWAGLVFAVLFGAGAGVAYVTRGSVVLQLYGAGGYAGRLGRLSSVRLVVGAATPFVLSLILERFGAWHVVGFCALAALLSVVCFAWLARAATVRAFT
ncbi:MAG: MFS transporter [Reyranellaceae bacterium]